MAHDTKRGSDLGAAKVGSRPTPHRYTPRTVLFRRLLAQTTMSEVGRSWGVSDEIVKRVREGVLALTDERFGLPGQVRFPFAEAA